MAAVVLHPWDRAGLSVLPVCFCLTALVGAVTSRHAPALLMVPGDCQAVGLQPPWLCPGPTPAQAQPSQLQSMPGQQLRVSSAAFGGTVRCRPATGAVEGLIPVCRQSGLSLTVAEILGAHLSAMLPTASSCWRTSSGMVRKSLSRRTMAIGEAAGECGMVYGQHGAASLTMDEAGDSVTFDRVLSITSVVLS